MTSFLKKEVWSPYSVGAALGVLSWVTFYFMNSALGVSTTFVRAAGSIEAVVAPEHVSGNSYLAKLLVGAPAFEWQFALVLFIFIGSYTAARLSGFRQSPQVPALWSKAFGTSVTKRRIFAFLGGVIALYGARLAGGCTSGHGISGGLQLAVSSWIFIATVFAVGIPVAMLLFRKQQ